MVLDLRYVIVFGTLSPSHAIREVKVVPIAPLG